MSCLLSSVAYRDCSSFGRILLFGAFPQLLFLQSSFLGLTLRLSLPMASCGCFIFLFLFKSDFFLLKQFVCSTEASYNITRWHVMNRCLGAIVLCTPNMITGLNIKWNAFCFFQISINGTIISLINSFSL